MSENLEEKTIMDMIKLSENNAFGVEFKPYRKTKKDKIEDDVNFLKRILMSATVYPDGEGKFKSDYMINDEDFRYNLQCNIMELTKKYLQEK